MRWYSGFTTFSGTWLSERSLNRSRGQRRTLVTPFLLKWMKLPCFTPNSVTAIQPQRQSQKQKAEILIWMNEWEMQTEDRSMWTLSWCSEQWTGKELKVQNVDEWFDKTVAVSTVYLWLFCARSDSSDHRGVEFRVCGLWCETFLGEKSKQIQWKQQKLPQLPSNFCGLAK